MYQIDYAKPVNVHFIGIGGISMSGLAEILMSKGFKVSGSDNKESDITETLKSLGAVIYIGQKAENITDDVELVVYTAAIHEDNLEFAEVKRRGIPMLTRAELLGQLMKNYENPVAVAGTHGKTTTTSMLSMMILAADLDPTVSVGGMLKEIGGNIRIGDSGYFVAEACEYTNSFLSFFPKYDIILNIEEDHMDFFRDIDDIRSSFKRFAGLLPKDGALIINADIDNVSYITEGLPCKVVTYSVSGKDDPDLWAENISYNENACASFSVIRAGERLTDISLNVPGEHNISNALAAIAAALELNIGISDIEKGLKTFGGTDRRFQYRGEYKGIKIIDDYAHHPTEIRATLKAALNYPHKTLWTVFQPHTYTRTKAFFDDFADVLSLSDRVILADIYAAREKDDLGMSSKLLSDAIVERGTKSCYLASFSEIEDFIDKNCSPGDVVITMGAGDIVKVADDLTDSSKQTTGTNVCTD
ncbi:MAG: UDP-N-acetylmuramate--L-alanine ligase [Lachnospiraceae bacterium]|nr:UDP-N-acetylmuramate--L-alanine ligase [Lachnospiraceae bacterium]